MMSMTADVIDIDELNTGKRREGTFGAIYWWMVKVGYAIAGALSGVIIWFVGFNSDLPTVDQQGAVNGLHAFFCFFPMVGTLFAMYIMKDYSIDEERANEIRTALDNRKTNPKTINTYYKANKLLEFSIADLNISLESDTDFTSKTDQDIKTLFSTSLNNGLHGMCFSPYLEGQDIGDKLSEDQISGRMNIIAPYTKWVRSFSCTDGNEYIPKQAKEKGLKTMVGAWIGDDLTQNEKEISALIKLGKSGLVDIAVVGNETLMRKELSEQQLIAYINRVKRALPEISVGYVDAYYQFVECPKLTAACDVLLANCYPFWEGCSIEQSSTYLKQMYAVTQKVSDGKPVIITETGWPNQGDHTKSAHPSESNAMKYFINTANWAQQNEVPLFYFSSFDESWKVHHEGDVGARWGLWDKNEQLKFK
jgi:GPH family glycoside/pentoside/hexuronide:cation symporter